MEKKLEVNDYFDVFQFLEELMEEARTEIKKEVKVLEEDGQEIQNIIPGNT
jgi:predicted N-acyltransferase